MLLVVEAVRSHQNEVVLGADVIAWEIPTPAHYPGRHSWTLTGNVQRFRLLPDAG